jgi:hypothetical protein
MRQLVQLVDRLDASGPDPHSRRLAAAIIDQMDEVLPDVLLRGSRSLLSASTPPADAWTQQATAHLRADHGWISGNWCELRPLIDGVACGQSWVDLDRLRDAAELFCALQREHAALATTLLARERDDGTNEEAPLVAAH